MTREELLQKLGELDEDKWLEDHPDYDPRTDPMPPACDWEVGHGIADEALLEYIDDFDITEAYHKVGKWYA